MNDVLTPEQYKPVTHLFFSFLPKDQLDHFMPNLFSAGGVNPLYPKYDILQNLVSDRIRARTQRLIQ